jgi:acetyl-CoA decarbonylase/synthase complex subunit beta
MPRHLKDRVLADIPKDIADKVATEEDVSDLESLRNFLSEKNHPVVELWETEAEEEDEEVAEETAAMPQMQATMPMNFPAMPQMTGGTGGVKIILKNARVSVDKIIIKKND